MEELQPKTNLMPSQNDHYFGEKYYEYTEANCLRNSEFH